MPIPPPPYYSNNYNSTKRVRPPPSFNNNNNIHSSRINVTQSDCKDSCFYQHHTIIPESTSFTTKIAPLNYTNIFHPTITTPHKTNPHQHPPLIITTPYTKTYLTEDNRGYSSYLNRLGVEATPASSSNIVITASKTTTTTTISSKQHHLNNYSLATSRLLLLPLSPPASDRSPFTYAESAASSSDRDIDVKDFFPTNPSVARTDGLEELNYYNNKESLSSSTSSIPDAFLSMGKIEEKPAVVMMSPPHNYNLNNNNTETTTDFDRKQVACFGATNEIAAVLNFDDSTLTTSTADNLIIMDADTCNDNKRIGGVGLNPNLLLAATTSTTTKTDFISSNGFEHFFHSSSLLLASQHDKLLNDVINTDPSFFLENHHHHHPVVAMLNGGSSAVAAAADLSVPSLFMAVNSSSSSTTRNDVQSAVKTNFENVLGNDQSVALSNTDNNNNTLITATVRHSNRLKDLNDRYRKIIGRSRKLQSYCLLKHAKNEFNLHHQHNKHASIPAPNDAPPPDDVDNLVDELDEGEDGGVLLSQIRHFSRLVDDDEATDVSSGDDDDESSQASLYPDASPSLNYPTHKKFIHNLTRRETLAPPFSSLTTATSASNYPATRTTLGTLLKWEQSRASMIKRWTWLTHQIHLLDRKIGHQKDINFHLKAIKGNFKLDTATQNPPHHHHHPPTGAHNQSVEGFSNCSRCVPLSLPFPKRKHYPNLAALLLLPRGDNKLDISLGCGGIADSKLREFGVILQQHQQVQPFLSDQQRSISVLKNYPWFNPALTNTHLPIPLLMNIVLRTKPFTSEFEHTASSTSSPYTADTKSREEMNHDNVYNQSGGGRRLSKIKLLPADDKSSTANSNTAAGATAVKRKRLTGGGGHLSNATLNHHPHHRNHGGHSTTSYDIDDMDISFNISDAESIILPQFKDILTPKWNYLPIMAINNHENTKKAVLTDNLHIKNNLVAEESRLRETHQKYQDRERLERLSSFVNKKRGSSYLNIATSNHPSTTAVAPASTKLNSQNAKNCAPFNNNNHHHNNNQYPKNSSVSSSPGFVISNAPTDTSETTQNCHLNNTTFPNNLDTATFLNNPSLRLTNDSSTINFPPKSPNAVSASTNASSPFNNREDDFRDYGYDLRDFPLNDHLYNELLLQDSTQFGVNNSAATLDTIEEFDKIFTDLI